MEFFFQFDHLTIGDDLCVYIYIYIYIYTHTNIQSMFAEDLVIYWFGEEQNNIHRPNCFGDVGSFLALILVVNDQ